MNEDKLLKEALAARQRAYAPYSGFRVGAALMGRSGRIYTGCNVENASYSLTICAERAAVVKAVSDGETDFVALALAGSGPGFLYPCGACLQVLAEFAPQLRIKMVDGNGNTSTTSLRELLPRAFAFGQREESDDS